MSKLYSTAFIVPFILSSSWHIGSYSKISPNRILLTDKKLLIEVKASASPLIYSFSYTKRISGFKISGEFKGLPSFIDLSLQGQKGYDDYPLRIGFIIKGEKKLNYLTRIISPEWLKNLFEIIPDKKGIDRVEFFNVTQNKNELSKTRQHPNSKMINETFFAFVKDSSKFEYGFLFKDAIDVEAIWVSSDGDDTKSSYKVELNQIIINLEN